MRKIHSTLYRSVACFVFVLLAASPAAAQLQGLTNLGTDFWMGFMPNYTTPAELILLNVGSPGYNTVTIELYGGGSGSVVQTLNYGFLPGSFETIQLDVSKAETRVTETPQYRAIHVTSTSPLFVSALSNSFSSSEGFLALPTQALGKNYYTLNYFDDWYTSPSEPLAGEFLIVAPYDSTSVTISTRSDTRLDVSGTQLGHKTSKPWTVLLRKGQTYLVQSTGIDKTNNITGSHVTSDRPIALLSGHQRCAISNDDPSLNTKNPLFEMLPPVDEWGTQSLEMPIINHLRSGDFDEIISGADGNDILVNSTHVYLNAGDYTEHVFVTTPTSYSSVKNAPFLVEMYSYSEGMNADPGQGDPFMSTLPSREQYMKSTLFCTPSSSSVSGSFLNYATFVARADSISMIKVNGLSVGSFGADSVSTFPGTNPLMGAIRLRLPNGSGSYQASSNTPFAVYLNGSLSVDAYGYPAAIGVKSLTEDSLPPLITERSRDCFSDQDQVVDSGSGIASVGMITDSLDERWSKRSYNCVFTLAPFATGDVAVQFRVTVADSTAPAYAAIYVVDRGGNAAIKEFRYIPMRLVASGTAHTAFSDILCGLDTCTTIEFKNISGLDQTVSAVTTRKGIKPRFHASTSVTLPFLLHSGDSLPVMICYSPVDTLGDDDSVMLTHDCGMSVAALNGSGVTGLINVTDLNFGSVAIGSTKCLSMTAQNVGRGPLTIDSADFASSAFTLDSPIQFPITLQVGERLVEMVCYAPLGRGDTSATLTFHTHNIPKYLHSIKDVARFKGVPMVSGVATQPAAGTSNGEILITQLTPNPSSGALRVKYELQRSSSNVAIEVYDIRGAIEQTLVASETRAKGSYTEQFDLSHLAAGEHFLRITTPNASAMRKFVIER